MASPVFGTADGSGDRFPTTSNIHISPGFRQVSVDECSTPRMELRTRAPEV